MKMSRCNRIISYIAGVILLVIPAFACADTGMTRAASPPIAQKLVREGDFATALSSAFGFGTAEDEVAAETHLGNLGIAPRNGWIADYPMTPDILIEVRSAVGAAAAADTLSLTQEVAFQKFDDAAAALNLAVRSGTAEPASAAPSQYAEPGSTAPAQYSDPTIINNYYSSEGPPVVTYYQPPPTYYYLYSWVPFPFWWTNFWFPGFFVLRDFHRVVFIHNRTFFISNHFNDFRRHRVFRIDPVNRFHGRTFAGIGVRSRRGFIATGSRHSERTIFNGNRTRLTPRGGMIRGGGTGGTIRGGTTMRSGGPTLGGGMRRSGGGTTVRGGGTTIGGGMRR